MDAELVIICFSDLCRPVALTDECHCLVPAPRGCKLISSDTKTGDEIGQISGQKDKTSFLHTQTRKYQSLNLTW